MSVHTYLISAVIAVFTVVLNESSDGKLVGLNYKFLSKINHCATIFKCPVRYRYEVRDLQPRMFLKFYCSTHLYTLQVKH